MNHNNYDDDDDDDDEFFAYGKKSGSRFKLVC